MPSSFEPSGWYLMLAGAIAICAMILPGISGSFILLLLGMYEIILASVKGFDWFHLSVFGLGCIFGLLSFVRLIDWLLKHYHNTVLATLIGFMLGALVKVWPWKWVPDGQLLAENVLPWQYEQATALESQLGWAVLISLIGFTMGFVFEKLGEKTAKI